MKCSPFLILASIYLKVKFQVLHRSILYNYNFEVEICQRNKETLQTGKERPENPVQKVSY